jgi:hypothetical protein
MNKGDARHNTIADPLSSRELRRKRLNAMVGAGTDHYWLSGMKTSPVLDYSKPGGGRVELNTRGRDVLVATCFWIAAGCGFVSYLQIARRVWTQPYQQHRVAELLRQHTQPSYVAPPFVGRKYVYESMWELWTTYCAFAAVLVGIGIIVASVIRSRRSAAAG